MKKIGIALLALVAVIAVGVYLLLGNLDGLVRDAIAKYGSEMTQAKVSVGGVKIDALDGKGTIGNLSIGNPKGFKTDHAFKVKEFTVAVDPKSVTGNVITVKQIAIIAPDVIYEQGTGGTNFDAIQKNISNYIGSTAPKADKSSNDGKKLIVTELTIRSTKAHATVPMMDGKLVDVSLPDITLHNLGKAKGGVTPGELGMEIVGALKKQLMSSVSLESLGKGIKGVGDLSEKGLKGAGDLSGKNLDKVKKLF